MDGDNPELQAQLRQLDHELEEGDITQKGYEKRRTMILSQYLSPEQLQAAGVANDHEHGFGTSSAQPSDELRQHTALHTRP